MTDALLEEVLRSAQQQGLHPRRGGPARTTRWTATAGSSWASSRPVRASNDPWRRRASPRAHSDERPRRAARARRPGDTSDPRSHREQERRRLRGRGEHLLCGQGRRRGHRLRHAPQVGHGRARPRARVRIHRPGSRQREPAQLPRLPAPPRLQGRQQGHPQVRRRQGQGEPRYRARRRHDEDRPEPRHRDRRVRRRRLRTGHPRRPGDGRPLSRSSASGATPAPTSSRSPTCSPTSPSSPGSRRARAPAGGSPTTTRTCR